MTRDRVQLYAELSEMLPGTQVALCVLDVALWDLLGKISASL